MSTVTMTIDNFEEIIENNDFVAIDFWAEWCGPCKAFGPTFEAASKENDDVVFAKVNTEQERELAAMFNVRSIPMVTIFRDKIPVFGQPGALPAEALNQLLDQVRELNMDEVREEYAKQVQAAQEAGK